MKTFITLTTLLFTFNLFAKCGDQPLEMSDIQHHFQPGLMKSDYFTNLKLTKRVRRCNNFSGCEDWSSAKATITLGEIVSSYDTEMNYHFYPQDGQAYFNVTSEGKLEIIIDFYSLDISAKVFYNVGNSSISLKSNRYFRPSGAHVHPQALLLTTQMKNASHLISLDIGKGCMELTSSFTQNVRGIFMMSSKSHSKENFSNFNHLQLSFR